MKYKLKTFTKKLLADTLTPVNIYLKLRDVYAGSILLESSDYHGHENSFSFICCDPIASFQVQGTTAEKRYPDGTIDTEQITKVGHVTTLLENFRKAFEMDQSPQSMSIVVCLDIWLTMPLDFLKTSRSNNPNKIFPISSISCIDT